jgi:dTMP kinase
MPLLVFEGIDGCGKTTQQQRLIRRLRDLNLPVATWREPGGTELGERLRDILLDQRTEACPITEVFGYQMARAQLVQEKIKPALRRREWVVLDRFHYSTLAYQVHALGLNLQQIRPLIEVALDGVRVDKCFWLRIDPTAAAQRRSGTGDRIEARGLDYLRRVHDGYQQQSAAKEFVTVEASDSVDSVHEQIWSSLGPLLRRITEH